MGDIERNDCLRTNGGVFGGGEREREGGGEEKFIFISNSK